jgi:uncharacterized protein YbaP (TraB family)
MTRRDFRGWKKSVLLFLFFGAATCAHEGNHPVSLWQVDGENNRIYLLGSIHLLRETDHPIPSAIYDAYNDADVLFMELDMDDADPIADQILSTELGLIQDDKTLSDLLGPDMYAQAVVLANALQIPLKLLEKSEPWYAAVNIEIMMLMRIGFSPLYGIEYHLAEMAKKDNKEILGFETTRQQLGFLDNLSAESQREMFMQSLAEGAEMAGMMDMLVDAWHSGDIQFLEESLLTDMQQYPELNKTIVVDRNRSWAERIEVLLSHQINYLIVVGTLHLVGNEGVPDLLTQQGYTVTQLRQRID